MKLSDPIAELNPLDDLGQSILTIELADPERAAREDHRYVEIGHYADHLTRYQDEFEAHDMLVLDYGELT